MTKRKGKKKLNAPSSNKKQDKQQVDTFSKAVVNTGSKGSFTIPSRVKKIAGWIFLGISIIGGIMGLYDFYDKVDDLTSPSSIKFQEDNFINGVLLPKPFNANEKLTIQLGTIRYNYTYFELSNGVKVKPNYLDFGGTPFDLELMVKNNRLYVSTTLRTIHTEELIVRVEFDKWNIFKPNLFTYTDGDDFLEVQDRQGNIALQLYYEKPGMVSIKGYFIAPDMIWVASDALHGIPKARINEAYQEIRKIPARIR